MIEHKWFGLADFKVDAQAGTFEGYASTFGNVDAGGDMVMPGAFGKALPEFLTDGFFSWGHDWNEPVAFPTEAHEDAKGLFVAGQFHSTLEAQKARTVTLERLSARKSMGLSIGYGVEDYEWDGNVRKLKTIYPLFETGLVMVPMNQMARMTGAKGSKTAIPPHGTDTDDGAWDGAEMASWCPADKAHLRAMHAWVDAESDPEAKGSYKFPHHDVSADGEVGAANLTGCSGAIAVLNGGRGGTNIPDADREGVWRHLARHLRDGERDVPELRGLLAAPVSLAGSVDRILDDLPELVLRYQGMAGARAKEGRVLSAANRSLIAQLLEALSEASGPLHELLDATESAKGQRQLAALLEEARFLGVNL